MEDINTLIEEVKEILENNEKYPDMDISYILEDKKEPSNTIVIATNYDEMIEINAITKEINSVPDWDYNIDSYILGELEQGKEIAYMNYGVHYGIWYDISNYYPEDIEHKKGMQKYLKYCKDNKITKEKIMKENDLIKAPDITNVMKYYKDKRRLER